MIALLQRVSEARVVCGAETVGAIGPGLCVLACAERGDGPRQAARLAERILAFRVFADAAGRMNRSVREAGGGVLLVPQFTLAADTRSGNRPSFTPAADPATGQTLFEALVREVSALHAPVATGRFGAHMRVALVNDGPVTFWLRVEPERAA
ncbi:MAG: D-tyrosyl-tRNA(Tyr) deacylase [Burkholderiales bacterium]|nr:D-tyrosyl-tRNA(Tyr) deacylase [Burkholderiales bacterium]